VVKCGKKKILMKICEKICGDYISQGCKLIINECANYEKYHSQRSTSWQRNQQTCGLVSRPLALP